MGQLDLAALLAGVLVLGAVPRCRALRFWGFVSGHFAGHFHHPAFDPAAPFGNPHTPLAGRPLGAASISQNVAKSPLRAADTFIRVSVQVGAAARAGPKPARCTSRSGFVTERNIIVRFCGDAAELGVVLRGLFSAPSIPRLARPVEPGDVSHGLEPTLAAALNQSNSKAL
jgi:hypothetical protein